MCQFPTLYPLYKLVFELTILRSIIFYLLIWSLLGCSTNPPNETANGVLIRIENSSQWDYDKVYVDSPGGKYNYGPVKKSSKSDYKQFEVAYQYAYVKVTIGDRTFILQPYDYLGEVRLDDGRYTYQLNVPVLSQQRVELKFIED